VVTQIAGLVAIMFIRIPAFKEFILLCIVMLIFSAWGAIMIQPSVYTIYFQWQQRRKERKEKESERSHEDNA
jgi:predicted RND superfamily exporter protein